MSKLGKAIWDFFLLKFIREKSKLFSLPGFQGISLYTVSKFFVKKIKKDNLIDKAASISFFFLLAIPPTFIFLFTLLPYIPLKGLENSIYGVLRAVIPSQDSFLLIKNAIHDFLNTKRNGLLSFAFLLGIITSSTGVLGIMRSFNHSLPGSKKRKFLERRLTALKITTLLIIMVLLSLALIVAQRLIINYVSDALNIQSEGVLLLVGLVRWLIIFLLFFTITSLIYTYGPALKERWRFVTAGSAFATILFIITTLGFSYYVNHFHNYNRIYGSIGTILVLILWIYINSLVLLIGFELNASINLLKKKEAKEKKKEKD